MNHTVDRKFSIAPMMDCTDRHDRYFMRLMSKHILLYSEMVTAQAVIHGDRDYLLQVVAHDMDSYNDFLNRQILSHAAVQSASSTFALRRVKYSTALPLTS